MPKTLAVSAMLLFCSVSFAQEQTTATVGFSSGGGKFHVSGRVFEDVDGDGKITGGTDKLLANVGVSDQEKVTLTGKDGSYELSTSPGACVIFCTLPAGYFATGSFYKELPQTSETQAFEVEFDFPLRKAATKSPESVRFVQTTDIHISSKRDGELLKSAIDEINRATPVPDFVVATGDLTNDGDKIPQFEAYKSGTDSCRIPFFHVFGNHDANKGDDKTRNYRNFLAPDYYSATVGNTHLLLLNSIHPSEKQNKWLKQDVKLFGRGRNVFAFQHYPPKPEEFRLFQSLGVKAVFSGHWHCNRITTHDGGIAGINHPNFLMGGIDGSPSSFRIVTVTGEQINSEFRFNDFEKRAWLVYPQGELTGIDRLLAGIYDTCGGVDRASIEISDNAGRNILKQQLSPVSPISWMAPLPDLSAAGGAINISIRASNARGEWGTTATVIVPEKRVEAAKVKTGEDWPQFMGSAQHTGEAKSGPVPPLSLRWFTPTHGSIDIASPVLYDGRLAIGVRDRDNLINNGVAILSAGTGKLEHFVKTDSAVHHSPAFAEDENSKSGILYATAVGGTVYTINPADGSIISKGRLGENQERWIYSAPSVQDNLVVLGNPAALMAVSAISGQQRWINNFGADWIPSYASPTLAGELLVMGSNWQVKNKNNQSLYALDVNSGMLKWTNECRGISGSISVAEGKGYALDYRGLLKVVDLQTGKDIFTKQLDKEWALSTPAIDPELVVVPAAGGAVYGFDRRTMEQKWVFKAGESLMKMAPYEKQEKKAVFSSPTIAGNVIYLGCSDGKLYALDRTTGQPVWSYNLGVPTVSTPCVSGNAVFTAAYDGNVYAFTGKKN